MESKIWFILSAVLLSTAHGHLQDKGPPTFNRTNSQVQPQQEYKEVITYLTPSQIRAYESGQGILEPQAFSQLNEEEQREQVLRNSQLRSLGNDEQLQAQLRNQEARQRFESHLQDKDNLQLTRIENDRLVQPQQEQRQTVLVPVENGNLFESATFGDAWQFGQNSQHQIRTQEASLRQNNDYLRGDLLLQTQSKPQGEDNTAEQWKFIAASNQNINLGRIENEQIILQGQLRSPNQDNIFEGLNDSKLLESLQARERDAETQRNIQQEREREVNKNLQAQIQQHLIPNQEVGNNPYGEQIEDSQFNELKINRQQYQLRDVKSEADIPQQTLTHLVKDNFLPLENAQSLYDSDSNLNQLIFLNNNGESLRNVQEEKLIAPSPTVQPAVSNNKPKQEDQTKSLLNEQGQILQQAHDTLKNLHQRLLQSQDSNKEQEDNSQNESNANKKEEGQQQLKLDQQSPQEIQNYLENNYAYLHFYPPQQPTTTNNEQVQLFHPLPLNENNQGRFNYEIQTDPLLNKKFNLIPYTFPGENRGREQNLAQVQNNVFKPFPIDNGLKGLGNQENRLSEELSRLQYAPQYNLDKFYAGVKEAEIRNYIERQKAIAKAAAIANSPPIVVRKEVSVTRRQPIPRPSPVPAPYLHQRSELVQEGVPQPYPLPIQIINPVPIQIVKTKTEEDEKRVQIPVIKNVFVPVDKPYIVDRYVPVEIEKKVPVEIPISKPEKATILRHIWKY